MTLVPTWRSTGQLPGCCEEHRLQAAHRVVAEGPEGQGQLDLGGLVGLQQGALDLHADDLGLVVAQVEPAPQDHDGVVLKSAPYSAMTRGKTNTSIEAWRSSRTKRAIRSPFFVYWRFSSVTTPPTERTEPSIPYASPGSPTHGVAELGQ